MAYHPRQKVSCSICGERSIARHLCKPHYEAAFKSGSLKLHSRLGPEDVFDNRYKVTRTGCWKWTGSLNDFGYGLLLIGGKQVRAHRYSYERANGKIPNGKVLMHSCDNPPCVNPGHLSIGTRLQNNRDAASKRRTPSGVRHWACRLTEEQISIIRKSCDSVKQNELARTFNVSQSAISRIINRKRRSL